MVPTLHQGRSKPCERKAGRSLASRLAFQQVEDLIHCAAHVIVIIIIAIGAISMAMNQTLLVTKLLFVSVGDTTLCTNGVSCPSAHDISDGLVGQCDARRSLAMMESAVPRPTVSQKASVSKMRLLGLNRSSLEPQLVVHRSMIPLAKSAFARLGIAAPRGGPRG